MIDFSVVIMLFKVLLHLGRREMRTSAKTNIILNINLENVVRLSKESRHIYTRQFLRHTFYNQEIQAHLYLKKYRFSVTFVF